MVLVFGNCMKSNTNTWDGGCRRAYTRSRNTPITLYTHRHRHNQVQKKPKTTGRMRKDSHLLSCVQTLIFSTLRTGEGTCINIYLVALYTSETRDKRQHVHNIIPSVHTDYL